MKRDVILFLEDIVTSIEKIERFIDGMNFDAFKTDDKTVSACVREIEVIGEAAKQIPSNIREQFTQLPWSLMAKMRDKLIHWYFEVDEEIVWKVAKERLPEVKNGIMKMLQEMEK
jgi:uncharacterized protein with HEPN domain